MKWLHSDCPNFQFSSFYYLVTTFLLPFYYPLFALICYDFHHDITFLLPYYPCINNILLTLYCSLFLITFWLPFYCRLLSLFYPVVFLSIPLNYAYFNPLSLLFVAYYTESMFDYWMKKSLLFVAQNNGTFNLLNLFATRFSSLKRLYFFIT